MTSYAFNSSLRAYRDKGFFREIKILRGIERESLRINKDGKISQKSHPKNLGSPLTNKDITTDFAEALIELVTPTFESPEELFDHLNLLHRFLYSELGDEILWNFSMPCAFTDEKEIRIAEYGNSNNGMLKHIYRKGLKLRYGSIMQCVSGIHYNFSFSKNSWKALDSNPDQSYINEKYLGMIRNIKRNFWFILEQFGASPIMHKSYLFDRKHSLEKYNVNDLFLPHATSLRMSDVGYQSNIQDSLRISYNSLDEFINALVEGIKTPIKKFDDIGMFDDAGIAQQLSTGILQIENELYDIVRPKRTGPSGSRPATLLKTGGVEYLELRGVDINPFIPEGIDVNKIKLLDIYITHSLISDSPLISDEENKEIRANQKIMVSKGRLKNLMLNKNGDMVSLTELRKNFLEELEQTAEALDEYSEGYLKAFHLEVNKKELLSEKILTDMSAKGFEFQDYALNQSKKISESYNPSDVNDFYTLTNSAKTSIENLRNLEQSSSTDINKYVELYNSKI